MKKKEIKNPAKAKIDVKAIEIDEGDGYYLRACKLETLTNDKASMYGQSPISFIYILWTYSSSGSDFSDAGFFWKSSHVCEWQLVPIATWMNKYKDANHFLMEYPQLRELFDNPDREIFPLISPLDASVEIPQLFSLDICANQFPAMGKKWDHVNLKIFRWDTENAPFKPEDYLPTGFIDKYPDKFLVEEHLKEHFLLQEIEQIKEYFTKRKNTTIKNQIACSLPDNGNIMPTGDLPAGGGCDFYCFYKEKNYNLPFKIAGYYDLREHIGMAKSDSFGKAKKEGK